MKTLAPSSPQYGRFRHILDIALPLVVVSSGHGIRLLSDRLMLSKYSGDSLKASLSAGIAHFTLLCFFIGLVTYANTFVAQYCGAGKANRVGSAVWQAIYLALFGGLVLSLCNGMAEALFTWFGHEKNVIREEITYFKILNSFALFPLMVSAMGAFWAGRGKTWMIAVIELPIVLVNIGFNYLLIYGMYGFPQWGILGAGVATAFSGAIGLLISTLLFFSKTNRQNYGTFPQRTLNIPLLREMVRFGYPAGFHIFLDLAAFTWFVNLLGRMSPLAHEASTIAFAINAVVFIPMIGLGIAISVLVGQAIGAGLPESAERSVNFGSYLVMIYAVIVLAIFLFFPDPLIDIFYRSGDSGQKEVLVTAKILLRYMAVYMLFDGIWIVINSGIKGAGDTRFSMWAGLILAWGFFALPSYLAYSLGGDLWLLWEILVVYVILAAAVFYWRYRGGRWKTMNVISSSEIQIPRGFQDTAAVGREITIDGSL